LRGLLMIRISDPSRLSATWKMGLNGGFGTLSTRYLPLSLEEPLPLDVSLSLEEPLPLDVSLSLEEPLPLDVPLSSDEPGALP